MNPSKLKSLPGSFDMYAVMRGNGNELALIIAASEKEAHFIHEYTCDPEYVFKTEPIVITDFWKGDVYNSEAILVEYDVVRPGIIVPKKYSPKLDTNAYFYAVNVRGEKVAALL